MSSIPLTAPPDELTLDEVQAAYQALHAEVAQLGADPDAWEASWRRWNELKCRLSGERARRNYQAAQDTADPVAEARYRHFREVLAPASEVGDAVLRDAFLDGPVRPQLEDRLGGLLFRYLELQRENYAPANLPLEVERGAVSSAYDRLMGSARVSVDGQTVTLPQATARLSDADPAIRHAAWTATGQWVLDHAPALHDLFDQAVKLCARQAETLGAPSFVPVAYRRLRRTDYGPEQVASFREGVRRHVVPALARLRRWQAREQGVPAVAPWDASWFPGLSLPADAAPVDRQLDAAGRVFEGLHPRLAGHFGRMRAEGLIDLANRPGKRPGAFCTTYDDQRLVAILCNSTGSADDVRTLLHEMGHAFQNWESQWIEPLELRWPTFEACEVHSMGMEMLGLPGIEAFFAPEQAGRFRKLQLLKVLTQVPYMALVDHFQHWVHEHPEASPEDRDATWLRLRAEYQPGTADRGHEAILATVWKRQQHVFHWPFYYIDYAIAQAAALQLWMLDRQDHERALTTYLELCRLGGSRSLVGLFGAANLRDPFDPDLFAPLVEAIAEELAL